MDDLLKKLNFKNATAIYVLNMPKELKPLAESWKQTAPIKTKLDKEAVAFALVFCQTQEQVNEAAEKLTALATGDALLWFCYPKGTSKKYTCNFNRDTGWQRLGELGWEPVRQVAIDNDWSALRFRNPDFIKTMTRSFAMTEKGKAKIASQPLKK
jgi:hypothetical protein